MDIPDDRTDESIPDGAVLMTANNILNLLEYSEQLTDEDVLFSDEFYISILSNLLTDKKFDIKPGNTPEEKVKSLKKLLKLLGETIEMDLSQISAQGIIMEHDKASAKSFLELLEELIKTLMNANLEDEDESEKNDNKNDDMNIKENNEEIKNESSSEKNDIENKHFAKSNNSEGNIFGGNKNRFNLDDVDVVNGNDLDNDLKNENEENDKDNIDKGMFIKEEEIDLNELKKEKEKEENLEKSSEKSGNNSIKNENNYNNSSNEEIRISGESFHRLNQSNIEKLQLEKMFKNLENKNDESYIRKTYSQNDLSSYEKQLEEREEENEHENEEENENENENENEKKKTKSEEKSKRDVLSSQEEVENKFDDDALNLNYNLEDKANMSDAPIMNVSHISEFSHNNKNILKDKEMEIEKTSDKKSNKKDTDENMENNSESKKSIKSIKTKSNKSTSNKNIGSSSKKNIENIDDDLPDLFIENKKSQNSNKFDYDEENDEENEEKKIKNINNNNYFDEESNMEEEENFYVPHSVPRAYNKMHLPSASKETESSQRNNQKLIKESNSSLTNSNISFHSKHSKKSSHRHIDEFNDISNSSTNKKNAKIATNKKSSNKKSDHKISTNKKEESYVETKSNRSKRSQKSQRQTEENDNDNDNENEESANDISKSSVYTNAHEKSAKSTASKKSETSKKNKSNKSITNSEKNKNGTSSKKSIKSSQKKFNYKDLLGIEIPMSDEEIKYEIMKELKKLYGAKAKQYFNKNFLDLIIENVKLARKTILKLETGAEPDDFFSREFLLKYQKEIQKILKYYVEEKKRVNIYKQNAIMSIGQNIKFMKKLKEAELKNILNEIEYKKQEREMQNEEEQNQIMLYPSYCYELQKQIYLAETQNQIDLINYKENEKKNSILEMEKAYNDRLAILTELLRRERRERINQKKLNQSLEYELKSMSKRRLKKQVEDMLDQIDEEDKKMNNDDENNQEEIEKILNHFV